MERLVILVGRPNKSIAPTKYFFKVPQVGRFIPLIGGISRRVESPLDKKKESVGQLKVKLLLALATSVHRVIYPGTLFGTLFWFRLKVGRVRILCLKQFISLSSYL